MDYDTELIYTSAESTKKKPYVNNSLICYSNTIFFTVLLMQFFIIYIVFAVYSNDLNIIIKDARTNMNDLSEILPEVSNILNIVKQICDAPEYKPYCHK